MPIGAGGTCAPGAAGEDGAVGRRVLLLGAALAAATGGLALLARPQTPEPAAGTPRPTRHRYGDHPRQVGDLYRPAGARWAPR